MLKKSGRRGMSAINIIVTEDGSSSIFNKEKNETYHSIHGAIQESDHVFIRAGLDYKLQHKDHINILEIGFGTGLNALLTFNYINTEKDPRFINYVGLEPYLLPLEIVDQLNYNNSPGGNNLQEVFKLMHSLPSNVKSNLTDSFSFERVEKTFQNYLPEDGIKFDLIYFDAFSPSVEPDLWTEDIFTKLHSMMYKGGILVTYCSKGVVRRTLQACNFMTERLPGPPGKHEMLRATAL